MIVRRNEFVIGKEANGKRFKFLDVKSVVDHESWEADVGEGAVQFEDCRIAVSDNVGKYIIIEAENEEEGYLAVSYLYGMLREKEAGTHGESPEEEDICEDYKVVIFAGYGGKYVTKQDNKMEEFLVANPGIKSRISFEVSFPSYNADDMIRVVHHIAGRRGYRMVHTADDLIRNYFEMRLKDSAFGNGREARVLVENMERHIAERYYKSAVIPAGNLLITKRDIVLTLEETRKSNDHSKDRSRVFGF